MTQQTLFRIAFSHNFPRFSLLTHKDIPRQFSLPSWELQCIFRVEGEEKNQTTEGIHLSSSGHRSSSQI